jgi:Right handed beta helix region
MNAGVEENVIHREENDVVLEHLHLRTPPGCARPLIHIGETTVTGRRRFHNIIIRHCVLDGATDNVPHEDSQWGSFIRNNGISLRNCDRVWIHDCVIRNCRSGGIVPQHCTDVTIERCVLETHHFDGIAPFHCERVRIRDCILRDNAYAGISIDGFCRYITISGCQFENNQKWKIWCRQGSHVRVTPREVVSTCIRSDFCTPDQTDWTEVQQYPLPARPKKKKKAVFGPLTYCF